VKIWCTLGPSSYDKIKELDDEGIDMFRINLSHVDDLFPRIKQIRGLSDVPICVDTDCGKYENGKLNTNISSYCLTVEDIDNLVIADEMCVDSIALSFANIKNVEFLRKEFPSISLTSKIEHIRGLTHLPEIAELSDNLLIDRGDLSRSISREAVPRRQKQILSNYQNVFVATNLADGMMNGGELSCGEINDIWCTMSDGAAGLVLAGETAIGKYPVETVKAVKRIIGEYENKRVSQQDNH